MTPIPAAAAHGHAGPAIFLLTGLVLVFVSLPVVYSPKLSEWTTRPGVKNLEVAMSLWALFIFGGATLTCAVAALCGVRL